MLAVSNCYLTEEYNKALTRQVRSIFGERAKKALKPGSSYTPFAPAPSVPTSPLVVRTKDVQFNNMDVQMAALEGCFSFMERQSYLLHKQTERDAMRDVSQENMQGAQIQMMRDMMQNWQETMTNMMGMMTGMVEKLALNPAQADGAPLPPDSPLRFFAPAKVVGQEEMKPAVAAVPQDPPLIKVVRDEKTGKLKRLKESA